MGVVRHATNMFVLQERMMLWTKENPVNPWLPGQLLSLLLSHLQ